MPLGCNLNEINQMNSSNLGPDRTLIPPGQVTAYTRLRRLADVTTTGVAEGRGGATGMDEGEVGTTNIGAGEDTVSDGGPSLNPVAGAGVDVGAGEEADSAARERSWADSGSRILN